MSTADVERPIVVGVDGSEPSTHALEWAVDEARRRGRPLRLVHGLEHSGHPHAAEQERAAAQEVVDTAVAQTAGSGLDVQPVLEVGSASAVLVKEGPDAEMIVLGARGHGGFGGLLLGSTSLQVAMHAACPVVVLRKGAEDVVDGPSAGRVVVGVDGSPHSQRAAGLAFEEAQSRGVGLTAVRSWLAPEIGITASPPVEWREAQRHEQEALSASLAEWRALYPSVEVVEKTVREDPAGALIDESAGAVLLAVGSHGRGGFGGLVLGSVSHAALHHAHCPVLVARR
ncbi:universal stress protein [Pseudonocardia acidicola]|uniref:Universal stress protein n=1 Tax=Pseudonocardia acidicola TaxID=2724939 RepID=A0ABX1S9E4_9PSEU|nr:universal stress protein [Pseudonocardia acidicola]NMH97725.1 universal stress protein [Pseudonocardia acidicola]